MDEDIVKRAESYASARQKSVSGRLGFGIHGTVFVLESKQHSFASALKMFEDPGAFGRERDVYERLADAGVAALLGFDIPEMIGSDRKLLALEMTIVIPPFVLDFAAAYLDTPPEFSEEIWAEWREKNEEQFGSDWPAAEALLSEFEEMGIFMLDPSPSNIRFR